MNKSRRSRQQPLTDLDWLPGLCVIIGGTAMLAFVVLHFVLHLL